MASTTAIVVNTVQKYIHYFNNVQVQLKLNNQSPVTYRKLVACCFFKSFPLKGNLLYFILFFYRIKSKQRVRQISRM
ncbi:IS3 family transposase [Savagea serpentis]|uniref:IS3 family transposase n=1 Tax=Savagea serpentis TaxID=2785297 RepID=UPI0038B48A08